MCALNGVGFAIAWIALYPVILLVACELLAGRRLNR